MDPRLAGNKRVEDSLKRLQQLVLNQYGKELDIIPIISAGEETSSNESLRGEDFFIPVEANGEILGTAIIKQGAGLDKQSSLRLSDLVRLVLTPVLTGFAEDIRLSLKEIEQSGRSHSKENVINLFKFSDTTIDVSELHPKIKNSIPADYARELSGEKALTICFQSLNPYRSYQAAIDVHETVGSWAFLMWSDIRPRLRSLGDLVKLGRCTIFVNDVLDIELEERDLFERFVKIQGPEMPVLVVGTRKALSIQVSEGFIDKGLATSLENLTLNLDKIPQIKGALRDSVELLIAGELQPKS